MSCDWGSREYCRATYRYMGMLLHIYASMKDIKLFAQYVEDGTLEFENNSIAPDYSVTISEVSKDVFSSVQAHLDQAGYEVVNYYRRFWYKKLQCRSGSVYLEEYFRYFVLVDGNSVFVYNADHLQSPYLLKRIIREIQYRHFENMGYVAVHGGGVVYRGSAVMVVGDSGSGKTTLLLHLLKKYNCDFITNDRLLFNEDLETAIIPMYVRIGLRTIKNDSTILNYISSRFHALSREQEVSLDDIVSEGDLSGVAKSKIELTPYELVEAYGCNLFSNVNLSVIIIPDYSPKHSDVSVDKISGLACFDYLARQCQTPIDEAWKVSWLITRNPSVNNVASMRVLTNVLSRIPVYVVRFGDDLSKATTDWFSSLFLGGTV